MRLRRIAIFFLLISGSARVFAEPGEYSRDGRSGVRAVFLQSAPVENDDQRGMPSQPQSEPQRRPHGFAFPDINAYSAQNDSGATHSDNARRPGRLTPEERRALRRQIDEVGHDIYAPKR